MYLMYVDESGDSGLSGSPTTHFVLSGLVVHETRWREFVNLLIAFRKTLRSVYALPVRDEIHSAEFLNGRIHAVGGAAIARHVRLAILRNTIDELAKINFISITNVVINKTGKPLGYDVFAAAWGTLFQRFENTLTHGNFRGGFRNDYGIVITDATAGTKLARMVRRMAAFNYIPHDGRLGSGSRNIPIVRVIEDPHGKDSAETLPIQMCDVCAYFLLQRFRPNAYVRRQRAQHYFDRLHPVLNHRASRYDSLGIVNL
jgi:Protein of unknown function (DUF3800)